VIKLNEALAPSHMSALVLNKFWPIFRCGVINAYLVIILINYYIKADVGVPQWNWVAINGPVSRGPGLAVRHLISCPLLMDVQPNIDGFSDVVHRMMRICLFSIERG
jgi:hypothetical protein